MCMLTFLPAGVQPVAQALRNGAIYNNDGHGFAIVAGKRLIVRKDMDSETMIAEFLRLREKYPHGPAMFHSRMGTAGSIDLFNVHPFRVGGDRKTVLAHNGIFPNLVQPEKGDRRSDTRVMSEDLIHGMDLSDPGVRAELGRWMGGFNKVVILTVNRYYDANFYIINEDSGTWDADTGIWYSNRDYQSAMTSWTRHYGKYTFGSDAVDSDECPYCWTSQVEEDRHCIDCNSCVDCAEAWQDCACELRPWVKREEADREDRMKWWEDAEGKTANEMLDAWEDEEMGKIDFTVDR